ncbi:30S ribosome-binding factor RbfA [Syntrophus aciditrophicus]|uniref:Ribosome-binding factor A n=1 Tax=Syntrophus aciditrophicus (strain SB) TaxID=56780 RepID=RBFA_SYNAS|nr:30S ribosome-binding factor RbfA [Syntrophus aciditrophicus]Q2LWT9.1 RecName: Full=Ribosome-binding factor A [Syntrophus aciditrophicus SB]ABC78553.1 ribosome-binding factor A [Syntrophus aciditrophicus SB]OPY15371.1 MAG: Ribosome-binding factor A [Syntrophus sp. PtaB.Bin075]
MTQFKRADRVADLVKMEIADILLRRIRDPRVSRLTVTGVKVSDDLRTARIFFVEMGEDSCHPETLEGLQKAGGFIRKELGKRLKLRYVPDLIFKPDSSFAYGSRIDQLINEIHREEENDGSDT